MRRLLFILFCWICSSACGIAQIRAPLATCLSDAEIICVARVTAPLKNGIYTFTVEKNLRGKAPKVITGVGFVQTPDDNSQFPLNSEWILMSHGSIEKWGKDISIGGDEEDWGYGDWGPIPIVEIEGKTSITWRFHLPNDPIVFDKYLGDGRNALSMDRFLCLLQKYPFKH